MEFTEEETILDHFAKQVETQPDEPAVWDIDADGDWTSLSWSEYWEECEQFAAALVELGLEAGDRVAICGTNRPEWTISDLGTMMAGGAPVGIYKTNSPSELAYVTGHSEAKVLVLENLEHWEKFDAKRDELPDVERVVLWDDASEIDDDIAVSMAEFGSDDDAHLDEVERRIEGLEFDDLASLIYTSGTTSKPKGVELTHYNLAFTTWSANTAVPSLSRDDRMVSYLPLSHIAEQMFTIHIALRVGYPIWFCRQLDEIKDVLQVAEPTIFFGVPRVWEKLRSALEEQLSDGGALKQSFISWCRSTLEAGQNALLETGSIPITQKFQYWLADTLFADKIKQELGFEDLRIALSAAAPIGKATLDFFLSLGITLREVYGQTEDTGPATLNYPTPEKTKIGTVGIPLPGVDVEIAEDGEILVKGGNVFRGYFKNPEATKETLRDGWLHTGDIGQFDDDGFLHITGRKKNIIITEGGKNIAPVKIEKKLENIEGVGNAVAIGDGRKYVTALLTIDHSRLESMAEKHGVEADAETLAEADSFIQAVDSQLESINEDLARVKTVKKFRILPNDFSQETGELTPTQKLKRRVIRDKYEQQIESMYEN